jgi:hypothetical protein
MADPERTSYRHKKSFTAVEDRKPSKKWKERSLYFKGKDPAVPE